MSALEPSTLSSLDDQNPLIRAHDLVIVDSLSKISIRLDKFLFLTLFLFVLFIVLSLIAIRHVMRIFSKEYPKSSRKKSRKSTNISSIKDVNMLSDSIPSHDIYDIESPIAPPRENSFISNPIPVKPLICNFNNFNI